MDELFEQARLSLPHVYWIGGPGCSGKTTTARLLGSQYDLPVFHVDDELADNINKEKTMTAFENPTKFFIACEAP